MCLGRGKPRGRRGGRPKASATGNNNNNSNWLHIIVKKSSCVGGLTWFYFSVCSVVVTHNQIGNYLLTEDLPAGSLDPQVEFGKIWSNTFELFLGNFLRQF